MFPNPVEREVVVRCVFTVDLLEVFDVLFLLTAGLEDVLPDDEPCVEILRLLLPETTPVPLWRWPVVLVVLYCHLPLLFTTPEGRVVVVPGRDDSLP